MKDQIVNYVRAGYPGLYIISHEEKRVEAELKAVADSVKFGLWAWSITVGLTNTKNGDVKAETQDPLNALQAITSVPEKTLIVLRDFHMILQDPNPMVFRKLKDVLHVCKNTNRVLLIVGCLLKLPPELEKEITVIEFSLPDREQLKVVLEAIATEAKVEVNGNMDAILNAASGLTTIEAENAFALSVVESHSISPEIVYREKSQMIKKNGLLEIVEDKTTLADIGGLEHLKRDLTEKKNLFTKEAKEFGLDTPRGILIVGQPGTGKSLTAKATGAIFGIPLLRVEAGSLFGSLVGETERNWRTVFATVKAISPCVLWIDEVDGLFSGAASSGHTDGGTTSRLVKNILQDMQMKGDGIFFVFTANDIDGLPDPLIDRLDTWSVELPTAKEREMIWKIHIAKRGRKPSKFPLAEFATATEGFSGRQIEQVWLKALTLVFNKGVHDPKPSDVLEATTRFIPTSVTMGEAIARRRQRLQNRATPAGEQPVQVERASEGRKLATA